MPSATAADLDHFIPAAEVRRLLGVGKTTLHRMVKRGEFPPPVKLGSRSAWPASDYARWVEERKAERDARAA